MSRPQSLSEVSSVVTAGDQVVQMLSMNSSTHSISTILIKFDNSSGSTMPRQLSEMLCSIAGWALSESISPDAGT